MWICIEFKTSFMLEKQMDVYYTKCNFKLYFNICMYKNVQYFKTDFVTHFHKINVILSFNFESHMVNTF